MKSQRWQLLKSTAVNLVLQEAKSFGTKDRPLVSLMRGQPDTPTPHSILLAVQEALAKGLTGYPDNQGEFVLRQAVAEKLKRDQGLVYDPVREILITDGATAGIFTAGAVLIEPGDQVLLPDPIYDAYYSPIAIWGGQPIPVPSTIRDGRFVLTSSALEKVWTPHAKVLLLNTPWNPTGTVFSFQELKECLEFAARKNLKVISDEIYETLLYDGARHISPAAISEDAKQRTILVNSLSKTYSMTGWRVGYCAASAEWIQAMLLVLQQFSRGPATFIQHAAAAALNGDQSYVHAMTAEFQKRRDQVLESLRDIPGVIPFVPQGGLFVMADIRGLGKPSDEVRRYLLQEAGVIVIHGAAYGEAGEGTLRFSFAGGDPALSQGLQRLREGLLRLGPV